MSNYATDMDRVDLADTLSDKEKTVEFVYGFMSAITFAYYKDMSDKGKQIWCKEIYDRVADNYGQQLLNEFLKEHFGE